MMGSEDFSYFLKEVPGAFAWIGNGKSASLHNPKYDFDDNILCTGASFLATLAEEYLRRTFFSNILELTSIFFFNYVSLKIL